MFPCTQEPNVLRLLEVSQGGQPQEAALQLVFPSAVLPHVALDISGPEPCLYAMTARGFLHAVILPGGPPRSSSPGQRAGLSGLASVSPDSSITCADLSAGVHAQAALQHCRWCNQLYLDMAVR